MKSCNETVDTVLERIHTYEAKKKHHAVLTRRIIAVCCAVSLLCVGVWYVNRRPMDNPINDVSDDSKHTTTTFKEKVLITVDPEDTVAIPNDGDGGDGSFESSNGRVTQPISPALKAKMEEYGNDDVVYAVIAQIFISYADSEHFDDISGFYETNKEMIELSEKLWKF